MAEIVLESMISPEVRRQCTHIGQFWLTARCQEQNNEAYPEEKSVVDVKKSPETVEGSLSLLQSLTRVLTIDSLWDNLNRETESVKL
jgi:hypothetical protein